VDIYQLNDLINGLSSNITQAQALFLTVLSAYLVVAYRAGASLTSYQVTFISSIFLLITSIGAFGQLENLQAMAEWRYQVVALSGGEHVVSDALGATVIWLFVSIRVALTFGALVFMWQIRHPKKS